MSDPINFFATWYTLSLSNPQPHVFYSMLLVVRLIPGLDAHFPLLKDNRYGEMGGFVVRDRLAH